MSWVAPQMQLQRIGHLYDSETPSAAKAPEKETLKTQPPEHSHHSETERSVVRSSSAGAFEGACS